MKEMKKQIIFLVVSLIFAWWAASASAAEVTLNWNATNFAAVYSDLNQSGYKVFRSFDDGITKELLPNGQVTSGITAFAYTENALGPVCYYVTAFNQVGESGFSDPACFSARIRKTASGRVFWKRWFKTKIN